MPFNLRNVGKDIGLELEKAATDKFGSVVDDFAKGALDKVLGRPPAPPGGADVNRNDPKQWYSTSYAAALAGGTSYRPKLKFLFKVQFVFTEEAKRLFPELGKKEANDFTFMIKSVDRPKIDFEYEDDVNMYNFRTKVLKRIRHQELTLVFMDDVGNRVFDFFRTLMMIHSPITRAQLDRDGKSNVLPNIKRAQNSNGMPFGRGGIGANAHRAVVNSTFGNSIEAIRVKQIFVDPSAAGDSPLTSASKMVIFDFINPRIVRFDLDELTHESSDPNLLTMVFDYDWMEMVNVGALGKADDPYEPDYKIRVPNVNGAPSDITPNTKNKAASAPGGSGPQNNPLLNSLNGAINRSVNQLSSDFVNRAVRSIAGNGRFANAISGRLSESLNSAIGGAFGGSGPGSTITGWIDTRARDFASGVRSTFNNTFGQSSSPMIRDSSTAGNDAARAVVTSTDLIGGGG